MLPKSNILDKESTGIALMALSIFVSAFWILSNNINVYKYAIGGAIFEILWLPMLASIFSIPIIAVIILIRRNTRKIFSAIALLINLATLLYLNLLKP
jgi:hypothetical protein